MSKEDYNKVPTFAQFIVIIFAVYGFLSLLSHLTGCATDWGIYGGMGKVVGDPNSQWERPSDTYGTFGFDSNWLIHKRDNVYFNFDAYHRSQFERDSPGENGVELTIQKRWQ